MQRKSEKKGFSMDRIQNHMSAFISYYHLDKPYLRGWFSIWDLTGAYPDYFNIMLHSDHEALLSDWRNVGMDIKDSIQKVAM